LVEYGSIRAEEGDWVQVIGVDGVLEAHVVSLALLFRVGVVTSKDETVT
jgi:hypothetical protein